VWEGVRGKAGQSRPPRRRRLLRIGFEHKPTPADAPFPGLASRFRPDTSPTMTLLQELEQKAGKLPEAERRCAELEANPSLGLSIDQFRAAVEAARNR